MKELDFYFDFISPYAYLAFQRLPQVLMGTSYTVRYKPLLFAALLRAHGQLGPAEIAPKRDWTYRQVLWLAREHGVTLDMPRTHPFNPLGLLRLAVACSPQGQPNRYVCETLFRHVWQGGAEASDAARLAEVAERLPTVHAPEADEVKQRLKNHADEALALGLFGVPSIVADGKVFWGLDALPMLGAYLHGDAWFAPGGAWDQAAQVGAGLARTR